MTSCTENLNWVGQHIFVVQTPSIRQSEGVTMCINVINYNTTPTKSSLHKVSLSN